MLPRPTAAHLGAAPSWAPAFHLAVLSAQACVTHPWDATHRQRIPCKTSPGLVEPVLGPPGVSQPTAFSQPRDHAAPSFHPHFQMHLLAPQDRSPLPPFRVPPPPLSFPAFQAAPELADVGRGVGVREASSSWSSHPAQNRGARGSGGVGGGGPSTLSLPRATHPQPGGAGGIKHRPRRRGSPGSAQRPGSPPRPRPCPCPCPRPRPALTCSGAASAGPGPRVPEARGGGERGGSGAPRWRRGARRTALPGGGAEEGRGRSSRPRPAAEGRLLGPTQPRVPGAAGGGARRSSQPPCLQV